MNDTAHVAARPRGDRRRYVLAAAMMAMFMAAIEATIVATAMPAIVVDLGDLELYSWVFAAYLLCQAVTTPIYGRLADLYGRKRVFFFGATLFLAGSTLCGLASSMPMLIAFRAAQGLGAGAIIPIAATIIGDIYTAEERARMQAYVSSVWGFAAIIGPALGAFIVSHLSWSLIFWINLPIGAAALAMVGWFLRESVEKRPHSVDYVGALLLIAGAGTLMLALIRAAHLGIATTAALAALGAALLLVLLAWERRAAEPMVPFDLWRMPLIVIVNSGSFAIGIVMMGTIAFLPAYVQGVMAHGPSMTGLLLTVMSLGWSTFSSLAGRVMIRTSYRFTAMAGASALLLGNAMLLALDTAGSTVWAGIGSFLVGMGMGSLNSTFVVSIQGAVGNAVRGAATASAIFMRNIGNAVGAALFGAVLNFAIVRAVPEGAVAINRLLEPGMRDTLPAAEIARLAAPIASATVAIFAICVAIAAVVIAIVRRMPAGLSPRTR